MKKNSNESTPKLCDDDKDTLNDIEWDNIFKRHEKIRKEVDYYQDILSTEECVEEALKKVK